ncbi:ribose-phosphate pyrophosphokinase 1 [Tanacetum coccineum]
MASSIAFSSGKLATFNNKFQSINPASTRNPSISCKVNFGENGRPFVQSLISNLKTFPKLYTPQELTGEAVRKDKTRLWLFSRTANPTLSQEIASYMGVDLGDINIKRFADGEIYVQLRESVRGCDVFLIQPTCPAANENLMELMVMIDACRRASAKTVTAVIPYFGYARADRKT